MRKVLYKLLLTAGLLLTVGQFSAHAQGVRRDWVAEDTLGAYYRPLPNGYVRVCAEPASGQPCTPLANLYSDIALTQPIQNPIKTDAKGRYTYYAAPGLYEEETSGASILTYQWHNILLGGGGSGGGSGGVTTCQMIIGDDAGAALASDNIAPQRSQCYEAQNSTMISVILMANAGASTAQVGYRHNGGTVAISPLLTPATVSGITDKVACANALGTAIMIEGHSVTCSALSNSVLTANDFIETIAGTADGTTSRVSLSITFVAGGGSGCGLSGADGELLYSLNNGCAGATGITTPDGLSLAISDNATVGGTFGVSGNTTLGSLGGTTSILHNATFGANAAIAGNLSVAGTGLFDSYTDLQTILAPSNPTTGFIRVFGSSTTGNLACLTSTGTSCMPAGGAGTPGGADTNVQYNAAGSFGGDANFVYNSTNQTVSISPSGNGGHTNLIVGPTGSPMVSTLQLGAETPTVYVSHNVLHGDTTNDAIAGVIQDLAANTQDNELTAIFGAAYTNRTTASEIEGVAGQAISAPTTTNTGGDTVGVLGESFSLGAGTTPTAEGVEGFLSAMSGATITTGANFAALADGFSGTVGTLYDFYGGLNGGHASTFYAAFYAANVGAGATDYSMYLNGGKVYIAGPFTHSIIPNTANSIDLGSSTVPFRNAYVGIASSEAAELAGDNLTALRTYEFADASGTLAPVTGSPSNNDCAKITVSGGLITGITSAGTGACSSGGGGGAFNTITSGTNSMAAMVLDTGASLSTTGSGTIAATSAPFAGLAAGTNTTAAMVVGAGASLDFTSSGTVNASSIHGTTVPTNSAADQTIVTTASATGSWASIPACLDSGGNHLNYNTSTHAFSCGTSGGTAGSAAFNTITSGTNASAAMVVGTGSSLGVSGSGTIAATSTPFSGLTSSSNATATMHVDTGATLDFTGSGVLNANEINGTTVPTNSTADQFLGTTSSATAAWADMPNCTDSGGNHINYNTSTHAFSCGTSGGTAGSAAFNTITSGTNASAAMVLGTGSSLTTSGTGTNTATAVPFSGVSSSTNTAAAMVIGSGASLTVSGTGTNNATAINGTTVPVNSAADQVILTTASATGAWKALPSCLDTAGNHLNYNTSTHAFSCGTSSSSLTVALSAITAATGANTISNGDNDQVWEFHQTTNSTSAFTFTESAASSATSAILVNIHTLSTSTVLPIQITAVGTANGVNMTTAGLLQAIGSGGINATEYKGVTASGVGSACSTHNFVVHLNDALGPTCAQPAFTDISGSIALAQTVLTTKGDILYADATPSLARLPIGTTGYVLTVSGGLPVWAAPTAGGGTVTVTGSPATNSLAQWTSTTSIQGLLTFGGGSNPLMANGNAATPGDYYAYNSSNILAETTPGVLPNVQSGTSYTIQQSDNGRPVFFTASSNVAVTLNGPGSYSTNFYFCAKNEGTAVVTITPGSGTIDGASTSQLFPNDHGCVYNNATNYFTLNAGNSTPKVINSLDQTSVSTANSGSAQTVATAPIAGLYRVTGNFFQSAGCATVGSGQLTSLLSWTDPTHARADGPYTFTPGTADTGTGSWGGFNDTIWSAASSAITVTYTYTACSSGTWTYDSHLKVEYLHP